MKSFNHHFGKSYGGKGYEFRIVKINNIFIEYPYPDYNNKRINIALKTNYRYFKIVNGHYYVTKMYEHAFYNSPIVDIISID